ncbi:hypothetical protein V1264_024220 [Littorina saxatilis]|uniref:Uncharacterized protein n=1 Tax=Littorina saxatilis TaxID=31220 RepID=A0AAN9ALZ8_9CAEN
MGYCLIAFIVLCMINPASTLTNGGTLYCQEEWKTGEIFTLSFHVDATIFLQTCKNRQNPAYFQKSNDGVAAPKPNCTVPNIKSSGTCSSGSFPPGTLGCGCTGQNNSHYMLEYNFIANSDYNGWWSADIFLHRCFINSTPVFLQSKLRRQTTM